MLRSLTIPSEEIPASIAYIHLLVSKGLGDEYDYIDKQFVVEIHPNDVVREPSLKNVDSVTLHYKRTK